MDIRPWGIFFEKKKDPSCMRDPARHFRSDPDNDEMITENRFWMIG
jgi:hypothetical protein